MKECGNGPEVINDEDGNSHIGREISYQADVGIETPPPNRRRKRRESLSRAAMRCPHRR